jgi:DNA-directed RNA polymerase subunit RPC12/RpoP
VRCATSFQLERLARGGSLVRLLAVSCRHCSSGRIIMLPTLRMVRVRVRVRVRG